MAGKNTLRDRIVDTALSLGERNRWEAVRLHDVATELGISLNDIRQHFSEKEDIADAWFDRADAAMLARSEATDFARGRSHESIHTLIMAWLDALAPHRKVTREIIFGKLEPGHLHIQIPGLMRVSRTVQWVREAAGRDATFMRRALEETVLTTIYLMTFAYWMRDDSADSERTRRFLERRLALAERIDHGLYRFRPKGNAVMRAATPAPTEPPGH